MQRLTLIFSDLYVPEEAVREMAPRTTLDLPNLDWLLRFAARADVVGDWRRWLCAQLGLGALAELPPASLVARRAGIADGVPAWLATPVRLGARLDHVRLLDRGLLHLDAEESASWCAEFAQTFGPGIALHPGNARSLVLTGVEGPDVLTCDPARLLDMDIIASLPDGRAAGELRRLGAEIDMWLHSSRLNDTRERSGRPRISSLWLWGGGRAAPMHSAASRAAPVAVHGQDTWLGALAEVCGQATLQPARDFAAVTHAAHAVVEFAPMSGTPEEALPALDARWLAPARAALSRGELSVLEVVANDRCFRVHARPAWRWWRARRRWFEHLGSAKA
jgi:hypothetical protein